MAGAQPGQSYQLTGKVANGSVRHEGSALFFRVRDRNGNASVPVRYTGAVPDPFRDGREVIVDVQQAGRRRSWASRTRWSRSARRSSRPHEDHLTWRSSAVPA